MPLVGIPNGKGPMLVRPTANLQMITYSDVAFIEEKG